MSKLFFLIGIAGSGKSYYAKKYLLDKGIISKIYSSDEYREKLLGDVNDQSANTLVFETLHKDIIEALKEGKDICYDATNVSRKSRKSLLNKIKEYKVDCEVIGILIATHPDLIRERNKNRERSVPEFVIDRMISNFEMPIQGEGFKYIITVFDNESHSRGMYKSYLSILEDMKGFDQKNPHHEYDLFTHCALAYKYLSQKVTSAENHELLIASMIHDFGKMYTQTWDEEKQICHYYNHENVGGYNALFLDYTPFEIDRVKVAFYINYHMELYRLAKAKEGKLDNYKKMFGNEWKNIELIHEADVEAH